MAFDPDAYLAAKKPAEPGNFDPDAYLASKKPTVDMGPEARRAQAGRPAERFTSAEQAGTLPGAVTSHVDALGGVGISHRSQEPAPADLGPGEITTVKSRHPGTGQGVFGMFGQPKTIIQGSETGEMADPAVQMATATALGMAAGAPAGAGLARVGAPAGIARAGVAATEGAVSNKAMGGDLSTGAALGVAPMAIAAAPRAVARAAKAVMPSTEKAIKNARGWVVHDIAGDIKGASTATARKQLADDADNASMLVLKDKQLDKAVSRAQSGNLEELNTAQALVQDRLDDVATLRLAPHWDKATQALPGGGVRSGDVTAFLKSRSDALKATGKTSEAAEAQALDSIRARVESAADWGATKQGFNPNTIVPAKQVQGLWSDEAGIAYKSMGGIHGTVAFERKLDVASHLRDFRDDMLAKASKVDPRTVGEIRAANRDYSALKRIENVLDQRINNAKANAGGASIPRGLKKKVAEFKQSPTGFVLGAIPDTLMAGKAGFDKWLARKALREPQQLEAVKRIWESPGARGVKQAVAAGVPSAVAMWAARAANQGVTMQDDRVDLQ